MRSTYAGVGVVVLLRTASWSVGQTPATDARPLVGTWKLTGLERAATTGPLARVANPSGIRIQSANGYVIQILTQSARAASLDAAEQFATYRGPGGCARSMRIARPPPVRSMAISIPAKRASG